MPQLNTVTQESSVDCCIKTLEEANNDEIGTKAKNLKTIREKTDFIVPQTLMLTTSLYRELLQYNNIKDPYDFDWHNNFFIPDKWKDTIIKKIRDKF